MEAARPPKRWFLTTKPHGTTTQKNTTFLNVFYSLKARGQVLNPYRTTVKIIDGHNY